MPHFRLVASGRPDLNVSEIILSKNDEGDVEHSVHVHDLKEIPEELLGKAHALAQRLGYRVVEFTPPEGAEDETDQQQERQEVGSDTVAAAPMISESPPSGAEIDQQAMEQSSTQGAVAPQTGSSETEAESATSGYGSSATSATTFPPSNT